MDKKEILETLAKLKPLYAKDGIEIIGLFGSYAKDTQNRFSDIDVVYKLDYGKFSQKYKDGFSKILKLDEIKQELQTTFKKPIDFIPNKNKSILKGLIYV